MFPNRIGSQPARQGEPTEPTEALAECHERIRHFSTVALRLARSSNASPRLIADSAAALRRYFVSALPLHERDEEDSVTPRLLEVRPGKAVEQALTRMAADHRAIDDVITALDRLWARVATHPTDLGNLSDELHTRALALASLFEGHLQVEEETIFPAVAELVPEASRKLMLREIRDRRGSGVRKASRPVR
ncbi:MAG: hemerythrin domain-containing protein [Polyangiaceae bacterium]|nr:hemerythrin domain-containing protein [Polyangiaceae bacterium]